MLDNIQILDQATHHFMQLGIKSVSMDELANLFGISKKTLYQQFDNKRDLVDQSITRHITLEQKLMDDISSNSSDALEEMVQMAEHTVIHFRQIKPALIHDLQKYYRQIWNKVTEYQSKYYINKISDNIRRGQAEGFYRHEAHPEIIAKLYVAKSFSIVDEQLFSLQEYDREFLITQHIQYHIHGLLSDEGRDRLQHFSFFNK